MPLVRIDKLVNGGQGLAVLPNGKKVFVWNALPGEQVAIDLIKQKRDYAEAVTTEIIQASPERVEPRDANYLSTSPWQIMNLQYENQQKQSIVTELFEREHLHLPAWDMQSDGRDYGYRNKMEFSFWGDSHGLHLALHQRGSHQKEIVTGSSLAMPAVNDAANAIVAAIPQEIRAGQLKSLVVRNSQSGRTAAALYTKLEQFPSIELPKNLEGLKVYYSNPRSPASVPTKLINQIGSTELTDRLLGQSFAYQVDSFFQGNIPMFERALKDIQSQVKGDRVIDLYAGVGSIGLNVPTKNLTMVDVDPRSIADAKANASSIQPKAQVVLASAENSLEYIDENCTLVIDPPRAGLHKKVSKRILAVRPQQLLYLSCNPATQARDIGLLRQVYDITYFAGYNFFPHTPHIETLVVLQKKV